MRILGSGDVYIEFSGEEGQTRMKRSDNDDFLYMLMPARLSAQDRIAEEEMGEFESGSGNENQENQNQDFQNENNENFQN